MHRGIWHERLTAINRNSTETNDDCETRKKWYFPSAVIEATHMEWIVRQILVHLGLFSTLRRLTEEIVQFHENLNISLTDKEITTFQSRRPDEVAFNENDKQCVFLELTRPMNSVASSDDGDWAERKESEKNARYALHRYFINHLSTQKGKPWTSERYICSTVVC